jgi:hypothetical protein
VSAKLPILAKSLLDPTMCLPVRVISMWSNVV